MYTIRHHEMPLDKSSQRLVRITMGKNKDHSLGKLIPLTLEKHAVFEIPCMKHHFTPQKRKIN